MGFRVIQPARLQLADPFSATITSGSMQIPLSRGWKQKWDRSITFFFFSFTDDYENGTEIIFIYRSSLIDNEITS